MLMPHREARGMSQRQAYYFALAAAGCVVA